MSSQNPSVSNAMSIIETRMDLPSVPSSVYELMSTLQSLKHTKSVLVRYLQSISLDTLSQLFEKADTDCDPYEIVIECLHSILTYVVFYFDK